MTEEEVADPQNLPQPDRLQVTADATADIHVLTPSGEIDHHTGDTLRRALDAASTPRTRVVVDLHQVTFMDSSGINILIAAHRTLTDAGGRLRLARPTDSVRRTLTIVGIDTVIDCYTSLPEALKD
ncbi:MULTISPECIES: STAS domain-containing protein [Streptomyces]|uniref:STAS domain-containing protein n=1 Tax=Streptomyces TaxID=1883 RepID=UPI0029A38F11|nr:STAS domain-containing protein [Streptomyces sp. WI03-4A]MDX2592049.1 STAS domain-containing protein [Streptomyces sp. WI03-4A]